MIEKKETPSLLESSTESFKQGFKAFKKGDADKAKKCMMDALGVNPYDIGAMIVLSLLDPGFQKEEGLFSSEEHRNAFDEITKSPHVTNLYRVGNNFIYQLAIDLGLVTLNLVDIGIGPATQEVRLLQQLDSTNVKRINIVGIEPMPEMTEIALRNLESPEAKSTGVGIHYENVQATGQNIPDKHIDDIRRKMVDVVLATISMHHANINEKRATLRAIKAMEPKFFILADANSDHESDLDVFSNELADNVRQFYSLTYQTLCEWADEHFPGKENIKAAFKKFNFDEARNILSREYTNVKDYHTTAERWRKLLEEEGFKIINPKLINGITNGIEGNIEVTDNTIYMMITEGRKLFFAIIAQPIH